MTEELGRKVTVEDIVEGRAPRPKVLDMFAGGGAIPLEALRLGCDAYALDLNPVAHIIELCTLVYPQKYGQPDPIARGMTGPKNNTGETTWGGLANEVRYWGEWVFEKVKAEIGDLYPPIPDPQTKPEEIGGGPQGKMAFAEDDQKRLKAPGRHLVPVAYLWTRTVRCKKPGCGAIPLARLAWLCKKEGKTGNRYVLLRKSLDQEHKTYRFVVVKGTSLPEIGISSIKEKSTKTSCPFCAWSPDDKYLKEEAKAGRMGQELIAIVCSPRSGDRHKHYLTPQELSLSGSQIVGTSGDRATAIAEKYGISVPDECLEANPRSFDVQHFGFQHWRDVFTDRQLAAMTAFAAVISHASVTIAEKIGHAERTAAVSASLSMTLGRLADYVRHSVPGSRNSSKTRSTHQVCPWCSILRKRILSQVHPGAGAALWTTYA